MNIEKAISNNKNWASEKLATNKDYFNELAKGQSPTILYVGCADSRVTVEKMIGAEPGDVFVHRNIANMVLNTDLNVLSVIDYAVKHLKVKHLVICGHRGCGGIKAAMSSSNLDILNPWILTIRDVYLKHQEELNAIKEESLRYDRLIELNVREQCINTLKIPVVRESVENQQLSVHGWVFDLETGHIIDQHLDFKAIFNQLKPIYELEKK